MFQHKKTQKLYKDKYKPSDHTFVICAYEESPYLEECVRSCLKQKVKTNVKIATSTPNEYIRKTAEKYHLTVDVRDNSSRKGIAEDWNFAVKSAHTPLVTLAHQDDIYSANYSCKILKQLQFAALL